MAQVHWSLLQSWSPERAWWFGVFLGDGCAPATAELLQVTGSASTVTRWRGLLTPDSGGIHEVKHAPGTFVGIVCSRALSDWMLQVHGYRGKKSDKLQWPEDLPVDCLPHFIRGLWDSDGCIHVQDKAKRKVSGNPTRSLIYTSISVPFVERLAKEIQGALGLPVPKLRLQTVPQTGNLRAQLAYTGAQAHGLADWLYQAAPEHLRNEDRVVTYQEMNAIRAALLAACPCGVSEVHCDGLCRTCFEATREKKTGEGVSCTGAPGCPRPVIAKGLCDICRKRKARSEGKMKPKVRGACACGSPATRKDDQCEACYSRSRRGVPTRAELPTPEGGWHSRAGAKLPGRPRVDGETPVSALPPPVPMG